MVSPEFNTGSENRGIPKPEEIFERLSVGVIDQDLALQQISVSLYKHLERIKVGNILLIGNSGTGKTTIMKAIEDMFSADSRLSRFTNTIRLNANMVANEDNPEIESNVVIQRLQQNALKILEGQGDERAFRELIQNGVVFLDETDKIRNHVGGKPNFRGILAQEALLTLIEGEVIQIPFVKKHEDGTLEERQILVDTGGILFICGGAFEGLYDKVYRRVASGETRDKLVQEYVVGDQPQDLEEKEHFSLSQYVRYEDMFDYGMTPQFLGRFDEIIVLNDLSVHGLIKIFLTPPNSVFFEAKRYFASLGIDLQVSREALQLLAERAWENHRIGARALRSIFKRILRDLEFDPDSTYMVQEKDDKKILMITREMVDRSS